MTTAIRTALRLVCGALGAVSFDQLQPGTVVSDEFGYRFGTVVGPYASPDPSFRPVVDDNLMVVVRVDQAHREMEVAGEEGLIVISGRYLAPVIHGPSDPLAGYGRLLKHVVDPGSLTWAERNRL